MLYTNNRESIIVVVVVVLSHKTVWYYRSIVATSKTKSLWVAMVNEDGQEVYKLLSIFKGSIIGPSTLNQRGGW
jgi:hypothetical protein